MQIVTLKTDNTNIQHIKGFILEGLIIGINLN